jgi:predicted transcriptional regulator
MASEPQDSETTPDEVLKGTAEIIAAYVAQNKLPADNLAELIRAAHEALSSAARPARPAQARRKPATPISRSVQRDYIICLEDGKKLKMLKRYLRSHYDMSPEDYRRRWGLPPDYPMVAPAYAARRSDFAKKIGLGRGVRG